MSTQKPTIGRIVIYRYEVETPRVEYPAIVTATKESQAEEGYMARGQLDGDLHVQLQVFKPDGILLAWNVPHDPDGSPGTWHWPEIK